MQDISKKKIGERFREIRLSRKIGIQKMAQDLKISRQGLYQIEKGETGISLPRLQMLADYLNVSPFELLKGKSNGRKTA